MQFSLHTKAHTFASRTSPSTDQSLQKSVLFTDPKRNSIFFLPSLRCFNFFATHSRHDKTAKPTSDKDYNNSTDRTPAGNTGLAKVAVQCSADTFVVNQNLVLRINICGENRHLRQARKRYSQY
jgi:hypothetical protein